MDIVEHLIRYTSLGIETLAAIVVGVGSLNAFAKALFRKHERRSEHYESVRVELGRSLTLGLELEIGADILRVATAPTSRHIGMLAAIIGVRSALNYLLERDIEHMQSRLAADQQAGADGAKSSA